MTKLKMQKLMSKCEDKKKKKYKIRNEKYSPTTRQN